MNKYLIASVFAVSISGTALATTEPVDPGTGVRAALAHYDEWAANKAYNAVVEARLPAHDTGQPDPVLDRLLVDTLAAGGRLSQGGAILRRITATASNDNNHYRLLLGVYDEETGAFDDALAQYRSVVSEAALQPEDRAGALLGLARMQMTVDPASALAALRGIDAAVIPKDDAWEFDLLSARAAAMAGQAASAQVQPALQRAWSEVPAASLIDAAPARVASDFAMAAARSGDRTALVSLLAVDRFDRSANRGQSDVAADLPLCGINGITPDDLVIIEVSQRPAVGRPKIGLVWANRPGIARPFLSAAVRSGNLAVTDGQAATFALRCRSAPSSHYATRNNLPNLIGGWMSNLGAYPVAEMQDDDDGTVSFANSLAEREARYGKTSVMLLPILFRVMNSTMGQIGSDGSASKRAEDIATRIGAILNANHAPPGIDLLVEAFLDQHIRRGSEDECLCSTGGGAGIAVESDQRSVRSRPI